jgi:hypothetical protein
MEGNVCKTCGGSSTLSKTVQIVGPLVILALVWVSDAFWDAFWNQVGISVVAVVLMAMVFSHSGESGMGSSATRAAAKQSAKAVA